MRKPIVAAGALVLASMLSGPEAQAYCDKCFDGGNCGYTNVGGATDCWEDGEVYCYVTPTYSNCSWIQWCWDSGEACY